LKAGIVGYLRLRGIGDLEGIHGRKEGRKAGGEGRNFSLTPRPSRSKKRVILKNDLILIIKNSRMNGTQTKNGRQEW
jgi:hypothetical protein